MKAPITTVPPFSSHPLRGLLIAQFFGAFNDNAWKLMVALLAIRQATANIAPGPELEAATQTQTTLTFVIFTLPLVLLSLVGGTLADRLSKRTVIIAVKVVEVLLMSAGTVALWLNPRRRHAAVHRLVRDGHTQRALRPFEIRHSP